MATHDTMAARVTDDRDPLTGRPRATCAWSITMRGAQAVCDGCGTPVTLDDAGGWIYA